MPKKKKKPREKKPTAVTQSRTRPKKNSVASELVSPSELRGGGGLMALRGGFKKVAGTGAAPKAKTPLSRALDLLFWVVMAAALAYFFYARYR